VPFALKEALERELAHIKNLEILRKVDYSDWTAPVAIVPKGDGCLWVCGNYKITVNSVLVVDKYPLPKPEDLMAQLVGGQRFSKLDLSQAYQQVLLNQDKYFTINTHTSTFWHILSACLIPKDHGYNFAGYSPYHLLFGQHFGDWCNGGLAPTQSRRSFETVTTKWVKVKSQKCHFVVLSVEYLGHQIDASGAHTTSQKVEAILQAPAPQDPQQLRSFLGLLHYYGKFLPNLSTLLYPLKQLLKSNAR